MLLPVRDLVSWECTQDDPLSLIQFPSNLFHQIIFFESQKLYKTHVVYVNGKYKINIWKNLFLEEFCMLWRFSILIPSSTFPSIWDLSLEHNPCQNCFWLCLLAKLQSPKWNMFSCSIFINYNNFHLSFVTKYKCFQWTKSFSNDGNFTTLSFCNVRRRPPNVSEKMLFLSFKWTVKLSICLSSWILYGFMHNPKHYNKRGARQFIEEKFSI